MSNTPSPAPAAPARRGPFKMIFGGFMAMCTGAVAMYANAFFDSVVKPAKPVANFAVNGVDGLNVTLENRSTGQSGWWDFGDGTPLEPYEPEKTAVTHAYPKPGNYSVKLIVRNFLLEENDRSVSVDLSNPPNLLPPTISDLKVEAIREQAPATYLITGKLANADDVVWKYGEKTEHVAAPAGSFEKYITIEKPGQHPIVLTALSKTKQVPVVHVQPVNVTAPIKAVYDVMVTI
ncbi:MAG: PKD domain-containing protein, partial [Gemmataceae bacterium]